MANPQTKTIICLANSRKTSGRCIAGKEVSAHGIGSWVRPISIRPSHELSEEERRYQDGNDPRLLDILTVPIVGPRPHAYQVENYLIDDQYYWTLEGQASKQQTLASLDAVTGPLWGTGSSYNGTNDRIDEYAAASLGESLKLVEVTDLTIHVGIEGLEYRKRKVRGEFALQKITHILAVTDPTIERQYLAGANGTFSLGRAPFALVWVTRTMDMHTSSLLA